MTASARNEGIRVLDELVCDAICDADASLVPGKSRGINPGVLLLSETPPSASRESLSPQRIAELRRLPSSRLLEMLRASGVTLTGPELLLVHEIAIERLAGEAIACEMDVELTREAMLAAVNKID